LISRGNTLRLFPNVSPLRTSLVRPTHDHWVAPDCSGPSSSSPFPFFRRQEFLAELPQPFFPFLTLAGVPSCRLLPFTVPFHRPPPNSSCPCFRPFATSCTRRTFRVGPPPPSLLRLRFSSLALRDLSPRPPPIFIADLCLFLSFPPEAQPCFFLVYLVFSPGRSRLKSHGRRNPSVFCSVPFRVSPSFFAPFQKGCSRNRVPFSLFSCALSFETHTWISASLSVLIVSLPTPFPWSFDFVRDFALATPFPGAPCRRFRTLWDVKLLCKTRSFILFPLSFFFRLLKERFLCPPFSEAFWPSFPFPSSFLLFFSNQLRPGWRLAFF